ncbi:MAG TPA: hypothetical protein DIS66_00615, partial [Candidatus Omnitrophica bacterium]|nr:hypothetical protein [Candidatus Omnitrophota bacterium]
KKLQIKILAAVLFFTVAVGESFTAFAGTFEDAFRAVTLADMRERWQREKGLRVQPYVKTRFDWTSNVFKASDQSFQANPNGSNAVSTKHSDSIWTVSPGVDFDYQGDYLRLGGSYQADFKYFNRFSEQNTQDQRFMTYAHLKPTEHTYLKLREDFRQTGLTAGSPVFEPTNLRDNTFDLTLGFENDEKQSVEFLYKNFLRDFQESLAKRYSYAENVFGLRGYHPVTENIQIFSGVDWGLVSFEDFESRDTTYWEIPVGVRGNLFWGWQGLAQIGFHRRNLESSSRNDFNTVTTKITISRQFDFLGDRDAIQNPTSVELGFVRRPVESTFSTATTYDEKMFYGSLKHLITQKLRGRFSIYAGNQDYEERVFTGSRVVVNGAVFSTSPNQVRRDDQVTGLTIGADYDVSRYLKLHLDYNYSRRESNVSGIDFTDNTLSLSATVPV